VELRKASATDLRPSATNVLYALSISNQFGLEAWNAFKDTYGGPLQLRVQSWHTVALSVSNATAHPRTLISDTRAFSTNLTLESWPAGQFQVVLAPPLVLLSNSACRPGPLPLASPFVPVSTNMAFPTQGDVLPDFVVHCTNRLQYALVDPEANRLIDMVCFRGLNTTTPTVVLAYASPGGSSGLSRFWLPYRIGGATNADAPTLGLLYQIDASLGNLSLSTQQMRDWCLPLEADRTKAIDLFREFCGLTPIYYRTPEQRRVLQRELAGKLAVQVPFVFTAKFADPWSWEVNDPTVHYLAGDLRIPGVLLYGFPSGTTRSLCSSWNVQLPLVSLGRTNAVYLLQHSTAAKRTQSPAQFDLELGSPDAWNFPATPLVNLHWLDRVHRGTPWQTVYLGGRISPNLASSYPATAAALNSTNDWPLARLWLENRLFPETGPALPSDVVLVNNTVVGNRAASGGGIAIADGATPTLLNNVIVSNSEGVARMGAAEVTLRANDVFGNSGGDYLGLAAGPTDLSVEPRFIAPTGDYRLDPTSPLLGAGDPLALENGWLAPDEATRRRGAGLELGAAEFRPGYPLLSMSIRPADPTSLPTVRLEGFGDLPCVLEASVDLVHWETVVYSGTSLYSFVFQPPPALAKDAVFFRARLVEH
jgi:parallel beta-helix repeat protein